MSGPGASTCARAILEQHGLLELMSGPGASTCARAILEQRGLLSRPLPQLEGSALGPGMLRIIARAALEQQYLELLRARGT